MLGAGSLHTPGMLNIRRCGNELAAILPIVNAAAEAYRGVIPPDCWHDPYMQLSELRQEIAEGVDFWGAEVGGKLVGVMGMQPMRDVDLIRHAYVMPGHQRHGIGAALIQHLRSQSTRRILVGTWAAASWAIDFYRRHGFNLVPADDKARLLKTYWSIPDRQIQTSVVLSAAPT